MTKLVLTFDNGPDPVVTPQVLSALDRHNCQAIFLPLGSNLASDTGQDQLRAIADAGHLVGNHTFSHPRPFGSLSREDAIAEIDKTQELLGDHASERLFRPSSIGGYLGPGVLSEEIVNYLCAAEYTLVMWDAVCEDWSRPDGSWIDLALERIDPVEATVLVLHDIAGGAMNHLDEFLSRLHERDIEVVSELPLRATPIRRGQIVGPVEHLLSSAGEL